MRLYVRKSDRADDIFVMLLRAEINRRHDQSDLRKRSPNRTRDPKMSLLFYLPLITWIGLFEVAQDDMRVPVKVKALRETRR